MREGTFQHVWADDAIGMCGPDNTIWFINTRMQYHTWTKSMLSGETFSLIHWRAKASGFITSANNNTNIVWRKYLNYTVLYTYLAYTYYTCTLIQDQLKCSKLVLVNVHLPANKECSGHEYFAYDTVGGDREFRLFAALRGEEETVGSHFSTGFNGTCCQEIKCHLISFRKLYPLTKARENNICR